MSESKTQEYIDFAKRQLDAWYIKANNPQQAWLAPLSQRNRLRRQIERLELKLKEEQAEQAALSDDSKE